MEIIEEELRQRRRERTVRLELPPAANPWIRHLLVDALKLKEGDVYELPSLLDYTTLKKIASLPISHLRFPPWNPVVPKPLADEENNIFSVIRSGDMLVHHPYESFNATVMRLIETAIDDPDVLAIKMTVYRTGSDSPFIPLLIRAAEAGKQVACLVELKARFDEQQNILLAQELEKAGVHVVYGILGLKTHTKTALVVRREPEGVRCYVHIGTGNYHVHTARLYDDLGLLTAQEDLTREVAEVFNYLTGRSRKSTYEKLLVAPVTFKERSIGMIEREIEHFRRGKPAAIIAKMNQLEDRDVCQALYRASQAGVPVDLVVRGFCVLRPGVAGLSENIRVISVIGRFLEHSRIFYFRNAAEDPVDGLFYIGSGDWMVRNLERRVEAITPLEKRPLRERIWKMLEVYLADQRSAWDMQPDGTYIERRPREDTPRLQAIGTQQVLMEWADQTRGVAVSSSSEIANEGAEGD
jgi:polyphosphate kinase